MKELKSLEKRSIFYFLLQQHCIVANSSAITMVSKYPQINIDNSNNSSDLNEDSTIDLENRSLESASSSEEYQASGSTFVFTSANANNTPNYHDRFASIMEHNIHVPIRRCFPIFSFSMFFLICEYFLQLCIPVF